VAKQFNGRNNLFYYYCIVCDWTEFVEITTKLFSVVAPMYFIKMISTIWGKTLYTL